MSSSVSVNFHCHSIFSDGDQTPEALAANFARQGVRFAALTDHDTLEGLPRFRQAAEKHGVSCLPGLEITSWYKGIELHILAYGFDPENKELLAVIQSLRQAHYLEVQSIAGSIRKKGTNSSNHSEDSRIAQERETDRLDPAEAIGLIHRSGGKAFFAHPLNTIPDLEKLEEIVRELKSHGLDGLEAIYDPFSEEQRTQLCEMAERHHLLVSAGTDIHSNNGVFAIDFPLMYWKKFRKSIISSLIFSSESIKHLPGTNPVTNSPSKGPSRPHIFRKRAFIIRIFLPTVIAIGLFLAAIWGILLPSFEQTLLDRKRELIQELTSSAWSILASYESDEQSGELSREEAQSLALARVESLRYGPEGKDYFWIQDLQPQMLMHPYRPDLNGTDVSSFTDARGVRIFVEFANLVQRDGEGYINYVWQWKDDPSRLEPKESYVKGFTPWDWVIGTGIYTDDVNAEIARIERSIVNTSLVISSAVILLLLFVMQQSMKIDRERQEVVDSLRESTERYHSLVEATTEGTLLVINNRCRYANPTFLNMVGYSARQMEFLELDDLVPHGEENTEFWNRYDLLDNQESDYDIEKQVSGGLDGVLYRADGEKRDCVFILNPILFAGQRGLILLAKELSLLSTELSQDMFSRTAQSAPIGIFRARFNRRAMIQETNVKARDFFTKPDPSLVDLFSNSQEYDEVFRSLQKGDKIQDYIIQMRNSDDLLRFVSLSASVVSGESDQDAFIAGTLQDVTDRQRGIRDRTELTEKLQASLLFLHEPLRLLKKNVLFCDFQSSVAEVVRSMTASNATSAMISSENEVLGIVTDHDLRARLLASGNSSSVSIHTIMSAPVFRIPENAVIYEALLLMEEKRVQHLAVEDAAGKIVNVVEKGSLIQFQSYGAVVLAREISNAASSQEVAQHSKRTPLLAATLIKSSSRPGHVTRMITSSCDAATERLIQLAMDELGPAPSPYAFIAMGSQGRLEQTLLTDQDNGIIFTLSPDADAKKTSAYFKEVGNRVCDGLAEAGYPYCRGGVMANNPKWCRSLPEWIAGFKQAIQTPEPQEVIDLSIFLDFRNVCGSNAVTSDLRGAIDDILSEEPGAFHHLAEGALSFKPPSRLLGGIYLSSGETERTGEIDLKHAMMPIVAFARLYALRDRIRQTHTLERVKELSVKGIIDPSSRDEIMATYDFLMQTRLQAQVTAIKNGHPPTNVVLLNQLGYMQHEQLKQAFTQISVIQKKISYDFLGGN
jgi:signal-transduction protein with cAMP-binding, CBS, and nucleotidyltransferase domain/predicted metal-dependent phosphoesterase TrpH